MKYLGCYENGPLQKFGVVIRLKIKSSDLLRVMQVALANSASARILIIATAHAVSRHVCDHFVRALGRIAPRLTALPLAVVEN